MANKKTLKAAPPAPKKVEVLDPAILSEYQKLSLQAGRIADQIEKRIEFILNTIYKTYGAKLDTWYFDGAEEGEVGDLFSNLGSTEISGFTLEPYIFNNDCVILLKDGAEWGFDGGIPTRWLFENFEEELTQGRAAYQTMLEEKKARKKAKSQEKEEQRRQILEKLSPEEQKLLGLK